MHIWIIHQNTFHVMTTNTTRFVLTGILAAITVLSVATFASPMAFADQGICSSGSGGECASNDESNGNPSQSATPEVPAGENPQPNPPNNN